MPAVLCLLLHPRPSVGCLRSADHRAGEKRWTDRHLSPAHLSAGTVFRAKPGSGRTGPDQMLFCDNLEIVHTLVEAGYAFAIMPDLPPARIPGPSLHSDPCIFHHLLWRCLPQRQSQCHTASVPVLFWISDAKRLFSGSAGLSTAGNAYWSHACCLHKNKNRPCGVGFVFVFMQKFVPVLYFVVITTEFNVQTLYSNPIKRKPPGRSLKPHRPQPTQEESNYGA